MAVTGMQGFETFLFNTSVLYNLLVVYAFVQALVLILMLCSFIQRWYTAQLHVLLHMLPLQPQHQLAWAFLAGSIF